MFIIPRTLNPDLITQLSQEILMSFNPILEYENSRNPLSELEHLKSDGDKTKLIVEEEHFGEPQVQAGAIFGGLENNGAMAEISNVDPVGLVEDRLNKLGYDEAGISKDQEKFIDFTDSITGRQIYKMIYEKPEASRMDAHAPDFIELKRTNLFVQKGGVSLNGNRLKRPRNCGGSNSRLSCEVSEMTSAESTTHNDVSVQVALKVLTDLVKERADNRRVLAKQAAEQAHIERTLDKLWKMG